MKSFILSIIALSAMAFSLSASADKIAITGQPIVVQEEQGVYVPAAPVAVDRDYYYLTLGGTNRVCYQNVNPALVDVNAGVFSVRLGDEVVSLHCYDYNPDYFVIQ
ncbi:hypothetical protein [Legionella oakridgensis]|uniref:Uncharacterized protein n=2 Tax=Legionella oakridgensis TaxID=29423 RepID=W0B6X4_9GAMM|nr:hypothetical protein [Legionella oakridgensis]AHE66278.1 hypothetical protein Loa_00709 [Legionella oakridgensis ATCC 33761 = DSM 21215]ETO93917.1 hypothetical protein LOR_78c22470 [Legionella oakridgensis RV-2-2007]KTD37221.1 hypothetical protein Loak_2357 [Legionella oakridgensis]STY16173.1 Uncharacterised protein [Legionella longbeachae]